MTKDEALRLALEALEKLWGIIDDIDTYGDMAKADEKLYRSLVERRQRQRFEETGISTDGYELHGGAITAIKAALEAKDEPVAWMYSPTGALFDICPNDADEGEFLPLYTTPPQRTWVKLTEEEIKPCWYEACQTDLELTSQLVVYFARAIEAKLKEKNT